MTLSRLLVPRWLATGGALVVASVVGVALLLQNTGGPACAAVLLSPPSGDVHSGNATFYDRNGEAGNCSFPDTPADDLYVALGPAEYDGSAACGMYLDVTGPKGSVRVKVWDSCPSCELGHIDLSRTAFERIGDLPKGIIPITYKAVPNAPTPGPITVRFKDHTSQWWFALLVDNHSNPLASMEVKGASGDWLTPQRATYNYWIIEKGAGVGPFTIKLGDVYGHRATLNDIKLLPEQTQVTSAMLNGGSSGARATKHSAKPKSAPRKVHRRASATASPSAVPSSAAVAATPSTEAAAALPAESDQTVQLAAEPVGKGCR